LIGTLEGLIPRTDGMISDLDQKKAIAILYVSRKQKKKHLIKVTSETSATEDFIGNSGGIITI
jgi:hypothetical protein